VYDYLASPARVHKFCRRAFYVRKKAITKIPFEEDDNKESTRKARKVRRSLAQGQPK